MEHVRQVSAVAGRDRRVPFFLEACSRSVVFDVLEARQLVRKRAHVAAALHVVLTAQR